jgi:hypothetical protein
MEQERRGPLTGQREPEWDLSEPWQLQQSRRVIGAFANPSRTAKHARRVLALCVIAALGVMVVGILVAAL